RGEEAILLVVSQGLVRITEGTKHQDGIAPCRYLSVATVNNCLEVLTHVLGVTPEVEGPACHGQEVDGANDARILIEPGVVLGARSPDHGNNKVAKALWENAVFRFEPVLLNGADLRCIQIQA